MRFFLKYIWPPLMLFFILYVALCDLYAYYLRDWLSVGILTAIMVSLVAIYFIIASSGDNDDGHQNGNLLL